MSLPDQPPRISKWFFLLTDALLLAVAAFVASHSKTPFSNGVIFAIVGCVATGALITAAAFVADYTRKQDEALDDRQRALEALARTVSQSAEQISIAANGLHEIAELTQKNLRHAEKLPHQLQEKIAEFQAQLANVNDAEKEELEKELAALRTSESERLDSVSDKIAKSAADLAKLEAATQRHLTAATDALAQAQAQAAAAIGALDAKLAAFEAAAKSAPLLVAASPATIVETPPAPAEAGAPANEPVAHPPKRPRKPRREETSAEETPPASPLPDSASAEPKPASEFASLPPETLPTVEPKSEEPPPIPAEKIPEVAPVAPHSAEPFPTNIGTISTEPTLAAEPAVEAPKPARKRAPKKSAVEAADTALPLDIVETPATPSAEVAPSTSSADGSTRLLVTAYIGIGNRLFIRGDGPGLSWDKGVPLQFVSIGKWRWESSGATAPVKFKLYKNDETECAALGTQSLSPGQQQEVTATF
jgi:hypothetical protein